MPPRARGARSADRPVRRAWATAATVATVLSSGLLLVTGVGPLAGSDRAGAAGSGSSTTTTTTSPTQGQITAGEAQVTAIEAQIAQQQATLDAATEAYDRSVVELDATKAALTATTAQLSAERAKLTAAKGVLRNDVIQSYISGTASTAVAKLFAAPSGSAQTRAVYEHLGIGDLAQEVARVQSGQKALSATQAKLQTEEQNQQSQAAAADHAAQQAQAASALSQATLAQVKGSLARPSPSRRLPRRRPRPPLQPAPPPHRARQAAAAQASQAAQVASTVSGGSAAATSANQSANQAAGSGGSGGSVDRRIGWHRVARPRAAGCPAAGRTPPVWPPSTPPCTTSACPTSGAGRAAPGVDCSGLTMLAWASAGVSMLHSAALQYADFPHVSLNALQPGDLLFYDLDGSGIDHVVMYVGPTLDGQATAYGSGTIIQAAHTGTVVTFDPLWYFGLVGAARP